MPPVGRQTEFSVLQEQQPRNFSVDRGRPSHGSRKGASSGIISGHESSCHFCAFGGSSPCELRVESKRPITAQDLYSFQWIADPQISPDGSQIAYTHVTVAAKHDGYDTALWIISGAAVRRGS